jgi:pimeloyl-ACP methyl ester carboxylesterase
MSTHIHPRTITVDGLSIRVAEGGSGPDEAMLLSPWPESIFAFEQVWPQLAGDAHVFAIDLPGFGKSQRREDLMNPKAMGEFIVHLADALALAKPHVVAPDVGTSATFRRVRASRPVRQPGRRHRRSGGADCGRQPTQRVGRSYRP